MRAVIAALLVAAGAVSAHAYTQQEADACTPDAFRLCSAFIPDAGRIEACLRGNRQRLTPECAAVFGPAKAQAGGQRGAQTRR
jgi:hypothetical protein